MNTYTKIFLTTTLPYANSNPHIGHMFEFVLADAFARFIRHNGNKEVFFNTGLDCHGTKIKQRADELRISPLEYIKTLEPIWKEFCTKFQIQYDNFYLTSDEDHHKKVQIVWGLFLNGGALYKKKYKGLYCVGCEAFKQTKELVDGKCPDHQSLILDEVEEENYFFKLGIYKDTLLAWLEKTPDFLTPSNKKNELINLINDSDDISVSRPSSRCPWGVAVPNDPAQVIYVWFDALLNYIFAGGYLTENDIWKSSTTLKVQMCGPDNLRFQAIIFQGMLQYLELPKTDWLLVHGMIMDASGKKMSKTEGNVIDPIDQLNKYGLDAVRYYTLAGLSTCSDSSWDENELKLKYNSDICNSWGNFVSRVLHLMDIKCGGEYFASVTPFFFQKLVEYENLIHSCWENMEIREGLVITAELVSYGNKYINDKAPWSEKDPDKVKSVISDCYHLIRIAGRFYAPVFPEKTKLLDEAIRARKKVILFNRIP